MKCSVCKKEISSESRICPYCGNINIKEEINPNKEINKSDVFDNKKYVLYTILFSIFLIIISYISINISLNKGYLDNEDFSLCILLSLCEGLLFVFVYLLYCIYKNKYLLKAQNKISIVNFLILYMLVIIICGISGTLEIFADIIMVIGYFVILKITSSIRKKELNQESKQTTSHPIVKFFSVIALIICYMIIVLPIASSFIKGLSTDEATPSTPAAISQIMCCIYPIYLMYFMFCNWINSHKLNFRLLIYPIMSALIYIIISINMICYGTGMAWFVMFSLIPEIIILIILFIVGFCKDLEEGERENQTE